MNEQHVRRDAFRPRWRWAVVGMGCGLIIGLGASPVRAGRPGLAALQPRFDPTLLPTMAAQCADGKTGWRALAPAGSGHAQLLSALRAFPWLARRVVAPCWDCPGELALMCAPDLDRDDQPDFLARLRWRTPRRAKEGPSPGATGSAGSCWRNEVILLVTHDRAEGSARWKAIDLVSFAAETPTVRAARATIDFVRLQDGSAGLRCRMESQADDTGCQVLSFWVSAVKNGRVVKVGEADPELCRTQ